MNEWLQMRLIEHSWVSGVTDLKMEIEDNYWGKVEQETYMSEPRLRQTVNILMKSKTK